MNLSNLSSRALKILTVMEVSSSISLGAAIVMAESFGDR
jgi:hypothetical protein